MLKKINLFFLLLFFTFSVSGDSDMLQAYMQDFYDGEDTAKVNILRRALLDNAVNESSVLLFEHALQYAFDNYSYADNYLDINNIILVSLNGLRKTNSKKNLDGVWEGDSGTRVTVSGSSGTLSVVGSLNSIGQDAFAKGYIKLGDQNFRNLTSTGNLTWSGQHLLVSYYASAPDVATGTGWADCTITMSANGQTIAVVFTDSIGTHTLTWTRYPLELLWNLFLEYPVSEVKAEIIIALGGFGKKNSDIVSKMSNHLTGLNALYVSGENVDYITVSALIAALMELDDDSSSLVLFSVLLSGYPEVIYSEALGVLDYINKDLYKFLLGVIKEGSPEEKFTALKAGINSKRLSIAEQGQLAETALELTLEDDNVDLSILRYVAVSFLSSIRWTRANDLALRHYYSMLADYQENSGNKSRLIEAIAFLGAVGNSEAALALGLQLGLINDRKEKTGFFDAGITLAIVQALGLIGDKAAFNHLLHAGKLSYNENITLAAREAIDRLKW